MKPPDISRIIPAMYLVVIGVFAIVLTVDRPVYRVIDSPEPVFAAVALATLLPAAFGLMVRRRVITLLDRWPDNPSQGQFAFGRGMMILQYLLALCHGALLLVTDWLPICRSIPLIGNWPAVPGLIALFPFLLSILLSWIVVYPADRAVRQIAVEVYLFRGRPLRPVWSITQYLAYNLRHQVLFILIPMLLILAASDLADAHRDAIRRAAGGLAYAPDLLIGVTAIGVAVLAPEILRHVWVTRRLPEGPLRDRLRLLCKRLPLRVRDILVWRSGGMIVNAAVMGVLAPVRYVLITDAMLERMDDTKIEAVFGHEAGHVKYHHIPCFLMFALISGCIVTIFSVQTHGLSRTNETLWQILAASLAILLAFKWAVIFGWVSRRFERQADVHGARTLTLSGLPCAQPCQLHSEGGAANPTTRNAPLCATAAHVFSQALHEVAVLNGIQPEARSWRHSSIGSRARFLQRLAQEPQTQRRFQRGVLLTQIAILFTAIVAAIWAGHEMRLWKSLATWLSAAQEFVLS